MKNKISSSALVLACLFLIATSFFFYPKWEKKKAEATIGWDVSGYYLYLPAIFIYEDVKSLEFFPAIMEKYHPTPDIQQAFRHENGNYVMKYSCGQAVVYAPFFFAAHTIALATDYEADGFSLPYQFMISFGSLLIAFLGLFFLRKILLEYFTDMASGVTILLLVLGSNYLDYSAINGALTHNSLFTIYSLLIWQTISFYKKTSLKKALFIGFLVGLAALIRPVEIISCLIPLLWGIRNPLQNVVKERLTFFKNNYTKLFWAAFACLLVGSMQLMYWKYAGNEWIIYSYEDQGFSWLRPHFKNGLFSFKSGWLIYTPMMLFSLIGFVSLWRKKAPVFYASLIFTGIFMYITFAWDIWWYGGSLGQRAMVQAYPVLAFPLAAFIESLPKQKIKKYLVIFLAISFIYLNLWLTYQAHGGGMYRSEQMTESYFLKILGRFEMPEHALKLLDTDEEFTGERKNVQVLFENNFERDSIIGTSKMTPIKGKKSLCLNKEYQESPIYWVDKPEGNATWVRATADIKIAIKEWNIWRMTHFMLRFYKGDQVVKQRSIRLYRIMEDGKTIQQFIDVEIPEKDYDKIGIIFLNSGSEKPILIDNLVVEAFEE